MLKMNPGYKATFYDEYIWNNFVPQDDPLVKIKNFLDLDFLGPLVKDSYNNNHPAGRDPIDPRTLFLICLLEFIEGLSDGQVIKKLHRIPLYRWFIGLSAEDKIPDDTTVSFFRVNRMGEEKFKTAFAEIIKQLQAAGLVEGKIQSQDATDMRADIALLNVFQLINKGRLNLLRAIRKVDYKKYEKLMKRSKIDVQRQPANKQKHFEELIAKAGLVYDAVMRSSSLNKNPRVRQEMEILGRILEEREDECFNEEGDKQLKEDQEKITGKMINPSDPDASWGAKSNKKYFSGYKVESNLDHKAGIITAVEVEKAGHPEEKAAAPLLEEQKDNLGIVPEHFTADTKYDFGNTRTEIRALGVKNIYIPLVPTKNKEGGFVLDEFSFENGNLVCPAGYPAQNWIKLDKKLGFEFCFAPNVCATCELRKQCTTAKTSGRRVLVASSQLERKYALAFNTTEQYELVMKQERYKIEPRQADLKNNHGLKRARYRGLTRVRIQAYLAVTASNFKKWFKYVTGKLVNGTLKTLSLLAALGPPEVQSCLNTG